MKRNLSFICRKIKFHCIYILKQNQLLFHSYDSSQSKSSLRGKIKYSLTNICENCIIMKGILNIKIAIIQFYKSKF